MAKKGKKQQQVAPTFGDLTSNYAQGPCANAPLDGKRASTKAMKDVTVHDADQLPDLIRPTK